MVEVVGPAHMMPTANRSSCCRTSRECIHARVVPLRKSNLPENFAQGFN